MFRIRFPGFLLFLLTLYQNSLLAQNFSLSDTLANYPKNYFHSPLSIPLKIISPFGSFRDNHFHSGLDISTQGKIGLRVLASAAGYISRIKIQSGGYGKVIYITHPNGLVTVYAHLNRFAPKIEVWTKKIQNSIRQFELDIHPHINEISLYQGEWIALSGNTGNSGGPHLHFEIRDASNEDIINPLAFGILPRDDIKPRFLNWALYSVQGQGSKNISLLDYLPVVSIGEGHFALIHPPILNTGVRYFLGLVTEGSFGSSSKPGNVYYTELLKSGKRIFSSTLLRFGFDQTRSINSFLDYKAFRLSHKKIQRSYIEPGNPLKIYGSIPTKDSTHFGLSPILESAVSATFPMSYKIEDIFGNSSFLNFSLTFIPNPHPFFALPTPDSIRQIPYNIPSRLTLGPAEIFFPANSLFDTLNFKAEVMMNQNLTLGNPEIPIKDSILLSWAIPKKWIYQKEKIFIQKNRVPQDTYLQKDSAKSWIKEFGIYSLNLDTHSPYIKWPLIKKGTHFRAGDWISIQIGDRESGLKTYNAYLGDQWILMEYDAKTHSGKIQIPDGHSPEAEYLKIILVDKCGNQKEEKLSLYF